MTFDQWYFSKVGVTVEGAMERGVYDIGLMEQCWEAAVKQAREDALDEALRMAWKNETAAGAARAIESLKGKTP